jgi:hypothetical protein
VIELEQRLFEGRRKTWGMLAYVLTLGKSSSNSRSCIYTGQIVMMLIEITLMTTGK